MPENTSGYRLDYWFESADEDSVSASWIPAESSPGYHPYRWGGEKVAHMEREDEIHFPGDCFKQDMPFNLYSKPLLWTTTQRLLHAYFFCNCAGKHSWYLIGEVLD